MYNDPSLAQIVRREVYRACEAWGQTGDTDMGGRAWT